MASRHFPGIVGNLASSSDYPVVSGSGSVVRRALSPVRDGRESGMLVFSVDCLEIKSIKSFMPTRKVISRQVSFPVLCLLLTQE